MIGTYNTIFLPPTVAFQDTAHCQIWVQETFQRLLEPMSPQLKDSPLTRALTDPTHLTIIMTTEFSFNGYLSGTSQSFNTDASEPLPLKIETALRMEIQNQLQILPRTNNPQPLVLFVVSCAIDTGVVLGNGINKGKTIGWNRIAIMSTMSADVQYVYKLQAPPLGDAGLVYDGWDFTKYVLFDGWSYFNPSPDPVVRTNPRRDTQGRLVEATYKMQIGGNNISIGFGTCLDSTFDSYPGTNLIALPGSGIEEGKIKDAFFQDYSNTSSPVVWHRGFLINDTRAWGTSMSEWPTAPAGYRTWKGTTLQTRSSVPNDNFFNEIGSIPSPIDPTKKLLRRFLAVSNVYDIPPPPSNAPQDIYTMYDNLSPGDRTQLSQIVQSVSGPFDPPPRSVMDVLRLYKARPLNGSTSPIPAVDAIVTQSMVKIPQPKPSKKLRSAQPILS